MQSLKYTVMGVAVSLCVIGCRYPERAERVCSPPIFFYSQINDIMKKLILMALIGLSVLSCKKDKQSRTIVVTTSNISSKTMYTIVVKNTTNNTQPLNISTNDGVGNSTYSFKADQGSTLNVAYGFYTQNETYGKGNLNINYGDQNLLHVNGGSGQNFIVQVP